MDFPVFGSGKIIAVPSYLADGSAVATPTPVVLAELQDVSIDWAIEVKTLYGNKRYAIDAAHGKGKIEIKAKSAKFMGEVLGRLVLGKQSSAGIKAPVLDYPATIPTDPYELTIDPPGDGVFVGDLGVFNADTDAQLTRVASAPAAGEYMVSAAGKYTFAAADAGHNILVSYEYSATSGGKIWTIDNEPMGGAVSTSMLLHNKHRGKNLVVKFNRTVSGKMGLPFKSEDYVVPDFEAQAIADSLGQVGYICMF